MHYVSGSGQRPSADRSVPRESCTCNTPSATIATWNQSTQKQTGSAVGASLKIGKNRGAPRRSLSIRSPSTAQPESSDEESVIRAPRQCGTPERESLELTHCEGFVVVGSARTDQTSLARHSSHDIHRSKAGAQEGLAGSTYVLPRKPCQHLSRTLQLEENLR